MNRPEPSHGLQTFAVLCLVSPLLAGCLAGMPQSPFTASSLAANRGQPHRVVIATGDLDSVVDRMITLAKQRQLTLVKQSATGKVRMDLAFRSRPMDRRILHGTRSSTLGYYSRYFVQLQKNAGKTLVSAVGVPVLNGEMACPKYLQQGQGCRAPLLRHREPDLVSSVRRVWGYNVSGSLEGEILAGLLAELKRSRPSSAAAAPLAGLRKPLIVAVFDIQDHTGSMNARTLDQLTEYLAAQVTQRAGFKVVPRQLLRSRLTAEKIKSYKTCVDQRCQIELGKAMAAQKSLATKLLRVGTQCALTALLYDLKTEATDRAASVRTGCTEDALLAGVEKLARQLK